MRWVVWLLAAVALVVAVGIALIVVATPTETSIFDLEVGDCFDLPIDDDAVEIRSVDTVDCSEPHEAEAVVVGELNPDGDLDYPDDATLFETIDRRCSEGFAGDDRSFGLLPVAPDEATWGTLGGRFVCVAVPFGGGTVTGSAVAD